jgi:predicted nucleic acid-binding protein
MASVCREKPPPLKSRNLQTMMEFAPGNAAVYENWLGLVRDYRVTGVQVHDARLVASMLAHGIQSLLTLNSADFERYAKIINVVHIRSLTVSR